MRPVRTLHAIFGLVFVLSLTIRTTAQEPNAVDTQSKPEDLATLTGKVVNESGQPLPGAAIMLVGVGQPRGRFTATDRDGYFKAPGLDPGLYRVTATSPGYVSEISTPALNQTTYYRPGESVSLKLIKGGVIAGTVTSTTGEPLVNLSVRAQRVRDVEGKPIQALNAAARATDDRGYYRLYGLQPGTYLVFTGGAGPSYTATNPYANDSPTYAPASTRDTAAEIVVRSGEEATADIRYRGEPGHSISGKITGVQPTPAALPSVALRDPENHSPIANTVATGEERAFQLNGVPDGDYEISATGNIGATDRATSTPRRLQVRGADVTGVDLVLAPLGSISGRINIEADAKLNCGRRRDTLLRETLLSLRREPITEKAEPGKMKDQSPPVDPSIPALSEVVGNDKNEFAFRNLSNGLYRLQIKLPAAGWFLRAVTLGSADQKSGRTPEAKIARDGLALKAGDKLTGVTINVTEGGAGLRGRLSAPEGQRLPNDVRIYLAPAEPDSIDNVLRFYEVKIDDDKGFAIAHIAPGRYLITARASGEGGTAPRTVREDPILRNQILKEAQAAKTEITFKPCERKIDYDLPYGSTAPNKQ